MTMHRTAVRILAPLSLLVAISVSASAQTGGGRGDNGGDNGGGGFGGGGGMGGGGGFGGGNNNGDGGGGRGDNGGGGGGRGGSGGENGGGQGLPSPESAFGSGIERNTTRDTGGLDSMTDPGTANAQGRNATGGFGGGFGGMGGFGGLGGLSQMFGGGFGQSQQQAASSIRTRLSSAIDLAPPQGPMVASVVNRRLSSLPSSPRFEGVRVQMDGRTAILIGDVASEADKRMVRLMVRLEPGVSAIEDRLRVVE